MSNTPRTDARWSCMGILSREYAAEAMKDYAAAFERELAATTTAKNKAVEALKRIAEWTGGTEWPMEIARKALVAIAELEVK